MQTSRQFNVQKVWWIYIAQVQFPGNAYTKQKVKPDYKYNYGLTLSCFVYLYVYTFDIFIQSLFSEVQCKSDKICDAVRQHSNSHSLISSAIMFWTLMLFPQNSNMVSNPEAY